MLYVLHNCVTGSVAGSRHPYPMCTTSNAVSFFFVLNENMAVLYNHNNYAQAKVLKLNNKLPLFEKSTLLRASLK